MKQVLCSIAVLLAAAFQCGCSWIGDSQFTARTTVAQNVAHVAGSAIDARGRNGGIEVRTDPSLQEVSIEAKITCGGETQTQADERLAATVLEVNRDASNALVVRIAFPPPQRNGDAASLTIHVPDATGALLDTSNGPINVRGLSGLLTADTSNGRIEVTDHNGPAHLDTSNAPVIVNRHTGPLVIHTSNGGVTLMEIAGRVDVKTSNGPIQVALTDETAGPANLDTSNAGIKLEVGSAFQGELRMKTGNASVSVEAAAGRLLLRDLQRSSGTIRFTEGGERSTLDTSNGSVKVVVRESPGG